jgi:hypothetical protein
VRRFLFLASLFNGFNFLYETLKAFCSLYIQDRIPGGGIRLGVEGVAFAGTGLYEDGPNYKNYQMHCQTRTINNIRPSKQIKGISINGLVLHNEMG